MISPFKNMIRGFFLLPLLFSYCWYYSTSDSLPPNLKTLYIPQVVNRTSQFGLNEQLTNDLVKAFVDNGRLKVVNEADQADLILETILSGYDNKPYSFDPQQSVQQYQVMITLQVNCKNVKENNLLWNSGNLAQNSNYDHTSESEESAQQECLKKLAEDVVTRTLTVW